MADFLPTPVAADSAVAAGAGANAAVAGAAAGPGGGGPGTGSPACAAWGERDRVGSSPAGSRLSFGSSRDERLSGSSSLGGQRKPKHLPGEWIIFMFHSC